ncbi:hypothetical protein ACOMHN_007449 [Nucella lapillus]
MSMMRARVQGHRWVDHPAAAVMKARVPGQWVDRPAAVVMEAREQGRCWIDHPAVADNCGGARTITARASQDSTRSGESRGDASDCPSANQSRTGVGATRTARSPDCAQVRTR